MATGIKTIASALAAFERLGAGVSETSNGTYFNTNRGHAAVQITDTGQGVRSIGNLNLTNAAIYMNCRLINDSDAVGEWWRIIDTNGGPILRLAGGNNAQSNSIQYWNGSTWVQIGPTLPSSITLNLSSWEILFKSGDPATVTVSRNGLAHVQNVSIGQQDPFGWVQRRNCDGVGICTISELIIGDGSRALVNYLVETELPTADGTDTNGTGTFADVDDVVSDGGATVLTLAANGDNHSFTSPARTQAIADGVVGGVSAAGNLKCDATGPQNARFYLKIGGTRYYSTTFALSTAYSGYEYTWDENPSTAANWTVADAEAAGLEWGVEAVT